MRNTSPESRTPGVQACEGLGRLDVRPTGLQATELDPGSLLSGPLCIQNECSTPSILQLEAGPRSMVSGCLHCPMDRPIPIHVSSVHPHLSVPEQTEDGTDIRSTGGTSMAQPGLVPSTIGTIDGPSDAAASDCGHSHESRRTHPPTSNERPPSFGRLASLRRSYRSEGLSDKVIDILKRSWRSSTESAYSSAWAQWNSWCVGRNRDPLSAPIGDILEFLLDQFETGKQYRTINTLRSAISMTHEEVDGVRIGQHSLVSHFLKGIYNCRPPQPKCLATWDVDIVPDYIRTLPSNNELSFQQLTHKLVMLMALSNADRCSDLAALDLRYHSSQGNGLSQASPNLGGRDPRWNLSTWHTRKSLSYVRWKP